MNAVFVLTTNAECRSMAEATSIPLRFTARVIDRTFRASKPGVLDLVRVVLMVAVAVARRVMVLDLLLDITPHLHLHLPLLTGVIVMIAPILTPDPAAQKSRSSSASLGRLTTI